MLTFLLAAAAPISTFTDVERIPPQDAAKRVFECGLGPVTTQYEQDLQETMLIADSAQSATDDQLACAYKAVGFHYTLVLPSNVQPRFDALLNAKAEVWLKAQARDWLSARNLLDRVPKYQKDVTDDGAFIGQVEALCGRQAKGAFRSEYGPHTISPDWLRKLGLPPSAKGVETMSCLLNVTRVAGYTTGFIGNEAARH